MLNSALTSLVKLIHISLIAFIVLTPFLTNNRTILLVHLQILFYIVFTWLFNKGQCGLTQFEKYLTGRSEEDGFIYSIVKPIIDVKEHRFNQIIFLCVMMLGALSMYKLGFIGA
jgi:hypothetical protein